MRKSNSIKYFFCFLLIGFGKICAQQKVVPNIISSNKLFFKTEKSLLFFSGVKQSQNILQDYSFSQSTRGNIRPVFCKMEDNLHKRFNVWILLRAGSDADYRRLIAQPYK